MCAELRKPQFFKTSFDDLLSNYYVDSINIRFKRQKLLIHTALN